MKSNNIFPIVFTGPSGSGKTELLKIYLEKHVEAREAVGYTTRKKRDFEIDGVDYNFVGKEEFEKLWEKGFFLERNLYSNQYYGMTKAEVEEAERTNVIFVVNIDGAKKIREFNKFACVIFITPPNKYILQERQALKGKKRFIEAEKEYILAKEVAQYVVINNTNEQSESIKTIERIIKFHRLGLQTYQNQSFLDLFLQ